MQTSPQLLTRARLLVRGLEPYLQTLEAMRRYTALRDSASEDQFWLVEHPPVFTLGLAAKRENLLATGDIPVVETERGGDVSYHAPGQAVVYTLLDLARKGLWVRQWVHSLEAVAIDFLATQGIAAVARPDAPGVYVAAGDFAGAKIAALGLKVSRGRCYHGIALNICMDLAPYDRINPCGHPKLKVIDMQTILNPDGAGRETLALGFAQALTDYWNAL